MNSALDLEALKRKHLEVEDSWYSCPKSPEGCGNEFAGTECTCGADEHNALVDAIAARLRQPRPPESGTGVLGTHTVAVRLSEEDWQQYVASLPEGSGDVACQKRIGGKGPAAKWKLEHLGYEVIRILHAGLSIASAEVVQTEIRTGMNFDEWWDARAFEFGYDSIKAAHTAAREAWIACIALAPEEPPREVPEGKDQGLTASPLLRQKVRNLLEACNSLDRSEESKQAMYEAAAEVESVLSGEPASGEPSNPNPIPQVPAPLPVEPATAPKGSPSLQFKVLLDLRKAASDILVSVSGTDAKYGANLEKWVALGNALKAIPEPGAPVASECPETTERGHNQATRPKTTKKKG
jgi:hypothetical protein